MSLYATQSSGVNPKILSDGVSTTMYGQLKGWPYNRELLRLSYISQQMTISTCEMSFSSPVAGSVGCGKVSVLVAASQTLA